ncbi:MAG TPA: FMN-binding protein [Anaerolineales bacterium]|nr:FMN-binding protein [Anaerolineales bacterium]
MSGNQSRSYAGPLRTVKKLFLSGIVIVAFACFVAYERLVRPDSVPAQAAPTAFIPATVAPFASSGGSFLPPASSQPTSTSGSSSQVHASSYKDGTYTGQPVDAYYGLVQVQVTVHGGSIQDVQFLQYPSDRRTSQRINSIAMPYLQQEALQAQSAQVDIISGATLTSEGFQMSLQSALQGARN